MKKLKELLKPYRGRLAAVAVTDALGMLMAILMPYTMSEIVDSGIAMGDMDVIIRASCVMLALAVLSISCNLIANKINSGVTTGYTRDICRETFDKINSLSYTEYSKIGPSGLLTRATDDIFNIEGAASSLVYTVVTVPIMLIGAGVLSFMADAVLSATFMLAIPPVMLIIFFFMRPLYGMWDKSDRYVDEQNKIVRERLSGLRVVRAFNNEEKEHKRAKFATEEMAKYMIRANVRGGYIEPIALFLLNTATVAIIVIGGVRAESGIMDKAGDIIAVIQYVGLLSNALLSLSWTIAWLPRLKVSVKRINEIHSIPSEDEEKTFSEAIPNGCDIVFDKVSFTYPGAREAVLSDISLEIKRGERVAIIGGTGSGKTTLVRLILSFFDATHGDIYIGGKNYKSLKKSSIRGMLSAAMQKAMIFEGTIRDNMKMGLPDASDEQILSALQDCCMKEFTDSHPEGLDFLLVGMGRNVSGGQKQRINMARAVIRNADVYIFDDTFSALDFLTESKIKKNLSSRLREKTQIIVTQRVSTAITSERIYVMDKGRIVGVGTHNELMSSSDIYREICISQLGREAVMGGESDA